MADPGSVTRLIGELHSTDSSVREQAAARLWQRYSSELLELAGRHLNTRVRRREDEEDLVQDVFKSFCLRFQRGDFRPDDRNELWKLLVTITLCKARNAVGRHTAAKRDYRLEQTLEPAQADDSAGPLNLLDQMASSAPGPVEAAIFHEQFNQLILTLPDPLKRIAVWKLEGYSNDQIAEQLGCVRRTVIRKLTLIRNRLTEAAEGEMRLQTS